MKVPPTSKRSQELTAAVVEFAIQDFNDAIWCPGGITHLDISLSICNNVWAFQQPVRFFQKGHTSLWQFIRTPVTSRIIA